ncbi:2'-5' RNA ligase, partial [mine drainage metagenome]
MRAFVAIPLAPPRDAADDPGPVPHLTLHFLGEVGPETVAAIRAALPAAVAAHRRFALTIEGVGAFPSADRPRVLWRGISEGREALQRLAESVRRADVDAGGPVDPRPFAPPSHRVPRARSAGCGAGARPPPRPRTAAAAGADGRHRGLGSSRAGSRVA